MDIPLTKDGALRDFQNLWNKLSFDSRVDRPSLAKKRRLILSNIDENKLEEAYDILAELDFAVQLMGLLPVETLRMREHPDIEVTTDGFTFGVEVLRKHEKITAKHNDRATEEDLLNYERTETLVGHGDHVNMVKQIVQDIGKKSRQCASSGYRWMFLCLRSDSQHHITPRVVSSAWREALKEVSPVPFCGLIFWTYYGRGFLPHYSRILLSEKIMKLLFKQYPPAFAFCPYWELIGSLRYVSQMPGSTSDLLTATRGRG